MKNRTDEKNRLWNEVLGKKRAYEKDDEQSEIELTMDGSTYRGVAGNDKNILKDANSALDELMGILNRQQADLQKMSEDIQKSEPVSTDMMKDLDSLQESLKQDYDVKEEVDVKDIDLPKAFMETEQMLNQEIIGQNMAVSALSTAIRRPFVMGFDENKAANVILICGSEGTGRHEAVGAIARECALRHVLKSDQVYTVDMSRYTSGSQEQVFLQDMYQVLYGEGQIICFEGFESSFAGFNRMISDLVTKGKIILNKRYVLSQGILVENQTGLVKNAVDALSAQNKYLVFITDGKPSAVQNTFGADFMYHVLDTITFEKLSDESIEKIIDLEIRQFIDKCRENLHINVTCAEEVHTWIKDHFDKTQGRDGIHSILYDFYVSASAAVLKAMPAHNENTTVSLKDGTPVISLLDQPLSRSRNSAEEIAAVNQELDDIVGLDEVKTYIRSLQSHIAMNEKRKQQGLRSASVSMHMIFTGNPGTGKTTIARLISRYMKAIGALSTGQLVEVTRADLVAQYVGQTAPLTMSVIRSALGGVLFIDEAYSLYRGKDDSFGLEAIDTLVKAMEDNRENLIVILAGYKKEMAGFLEANSGLKSRFPNVINFKDYTGEELVRIAEIQASSKGYVIHEEAKEDLRAFFDRKQEENAAEAGNGRLARNTIEEAILRQSSRIVNQENPDMSLLVKEDFDLS